MVQLRLRCGQHLEVYVVVLIERVVKVLEAHCVVRGVEYRCQQFETAVPSCQCKMNHGIHLTLHLHHCSAKDILEDRTAVLGPTTVLPKPVSLNYSQQSTKKVRAVSFSKLQDVIVPNPRLRGVEADNDATATWYSKSENDTFLTNAIERAERIDRIMQYAKSTGEASYNASTGLVSPQVLHEYISTPEEIIGVEYYLLPQKKARDNLKRHHVNVLLGVQAQAGGPMMVDSDLYRLHESSTISTHMALERASYINKLT